MSAQEQSTASTEPVEQLRLFRETLRRWLRENLGALDRRRVDEEFRYKTVAGLYDAGLIALTWPVEYGGRGQSADYQTVFNEETAPYSWALPDQSVTVGICANVLLDFGSEEQKTKHLARMLRGDELWTQLLSEPGAGSDLGAVRTQARPTETGWTISGQKVWTSDATKSRYAVALVRTGAPETRHHGVSVFIVDLESDGVDVRPLRQMTGEAEFSEVFLSDVVVQPSDLVGELNNGWNVLLRMLYHERLALSAGTVGERMGGDRFAVLSDIARDLGVIGDPMVRAGLVDLYVQQRLLDWLGARMRHAQEAGLADGPIGSLGKLGIARANRGAAELGMLILAGRGQAWRKDDTIAVGVSQLLLSFPRTAIAGGTTEIQKNTIAERLLGLPRDRGPRDIRRAAD
jgi:alkylation response protein AidB-like acyl-CoA dehydrogenase